MIKSASPIRSIVRLGLSLIEIMIALTMTLIVLGAMMTAFQYASKEMQAGRAVMELANRTRVAESLLRSDLAGLTVQPRPYTQTTLPSGYFEYIEGSQRDATATAASINDSYLGDVDDILGMTVRANGRPFRGRWRDLTAGTPDTKMIESPLAEVVWFTTWTDNYGNPTEIKFDETIRVHRRVLLIAPESISANYPLLLDEVNLLRNAAGDPSVTEFFQRNDISASVVPGSTAGKYDVIANSLADLAIRKNRFCHFPDPANPSNDPDTHNFPNFLNRDLLIQRLSTDDFSIISGNSPNSVLNSNDIMLSDISAFDLQIYSPDTIVNVTAGHIVEPSDYGYINVSAATDLKLGAYVDLVSAGNGWFDAVSDTKSQLNYEEFVNSVSIGFSNVYDTWTPHYESDGINQDKNLDNLVDEGTDGLDNDSTNGVDGTAERETQPPYPHPIRGMKITIRSVEKVTKQVHQTTIYHSFVPQ